MEKAEPIVAIPSLSTLIKWFFDRSSLALFLGLFWIFPCVYLIAASIHAGKAIVSSPDFFIVAIVALIGLSVFGYALWDVSMKAKCVRKGQLVTGKFNHAAPLAGFEKIYRNANMDKRAGYIHYSFKTLQGEEMTKRRFTRKLAAFDHLKAGDPLPILYLPNNPSINYIADNHKLSASS